MDVGFESPDLRREWERWSRHFGEDDPYESLNTVGIRDVLRAHFLIADYFISQGFGMGGVGPRDPGLLHSAVYRQFTAFGGKDKWTSDFERAATLIFGLVNDHPFHDGNKRTALLTLLLALSKMNRTPTVKQKQLENLMVQIAEGTLQASTRRKSFNAGPDSEVLYLADYLRRNSRVRDSKFYAITYWELNARLLSFGFYLDNPSGNFIDVCKREVRKRFLRKDELVVHKLAQIGFPGWKSQVGQGAIATVRRKTGLTAEAGVDSAAFFHGADALGALIDEYAGPLRRLASR